MVTFQELVLQRFSDKEPTRLQSSKNLGEIIHEPFRVSTFQDTQCSREREVPTKGYRPSDLFIN